MVKVKTVSKPEGISKLDEYLSLPLLLPEARRHLLFKICELSQLLNSLVHDYYWSQLSDLDLDGTVRVDEKFPDFESLESTSQKVSEKRQKRAKKEKKKKEKHDKFYQEVSAMIMQAEDLLSKDPIQAGELFENIERKIRKKRGLFYDKKPTWQLLVESWSKLSRSDAIRIAKHLPEEFRKDLIIRLYRESPLSASEWTIAARILNKQTIHDLLLALLDEDEPILTLPEDLITSLYDRLGKEILYYPTDDSEARDAKKRRVSGLEKLVKLNHLIRDDVPRVIQENLEQLIIKTIEHEHFKENDWIDQFELLELFMEELHRLDSTRERSTEFLTKELPERHEHLADFFISFWYGMIPTNLKEAREILETIKSMKDPQGQLTEKVNLMSNELHAEERGDDDTDFSGMGTLVIQALLTRSYRAIFQGYFLQLLKRGFFREVRELADLPFCPSVLREIVKIMSILIDPEKAREVYSKEDFEDDKIGQFLFIDSLEEKVEFLRKRTKNGTRSLPKLFWSKPDSSKLLYSLKHMVGDPEEDALMGVFLSNEQEQHRFQRYLKLHGYGAYTHEHVDPHLFVTLMAWDALYPKEVESLLRHMWDEMRPEFVLKAPDITEFIGQPIDPRELQYAIFDAPRAVRSGYGHDFLTIDLVKKTVLERCRLLFSVRPTLLGDLLLKWIKEELVEKTITIMEDANYYQIRFPSWMPFYTGLLAAEQLAKIDASRSEDLISYLVREFDAEATFIALAGEIYAKEKGLDALKSSITLKNEQLMSNWQIGIINAAQNEIALLLRLDFLSRLTN